MLDQGAVRGVEALGGFQFLKIEVPDAVVTLRVDEGQAPPDWVTRTDPTRAWVDRWLREASTAVLLVRSVLVPETYDALINPRHTDATQTRLLSALAYPLDARLFAHSS